MALSLPLGLGSGRGTSTETGDSVRLSGKLCPAASVNSCLVVVYPLFSTETSCRPGATSLITTGLPPVVPTWVPSRLTAAPGKFART